MRNYNWLNAVKCISKGQRGWTFWGKYLYGIWNITLDILEQWKLWSTKHGTLKKDISPRLWSIFFTFYASFNPCRFSVFASVCRPSGCRTFTTSYIQMPSQALTIKLLSQVFTKTIHQHNTFLWSPLPQWIKTISVSRAAVWTTESWRINIHQQHSCCLRHCQEKK